MELSVLKEKMENGEPLGRLLVFSCEDREIANAYVARISEVYGLRITPKDTMAEALSESSEGGFIEDEPKLLVVRDDAKFASNEKAWAIPEYDGTVVLVMQAKDCKAQFSRAMDQVGAFVEFKRISHKVMWSQVLDGMFGGAMPERCLDDLATLCEDDYGRCASEADKIMRLSSEANRDVSWAFDYLWRKGQLGIGRINDRYNFANSFVMGSVESFDMAYAVDPLELISLLYAQCRYMYLAITNASHPNPCKATGMSYAQFNAYRNKRHSIRTPDLIRVMRVLQEAERGIKTGAMPKELSMKYVMAKAFGYAFKPRLEGGQYA